VLAATGETTHPSAGNPIAPEPDGTQTPTSLPAPTEVSGPTGLTAPASRSSAHFAREFVIPWLAAEEFPATRRLYERLSERDVAAIERLIAEDPELAAAYDSNADVMARRQMVLAYGIWLEHNAATEKTGLIARQPPEEVHLMARGPLAAAGGLYEADFVVDALTSVDVDMTTVTQALDFGCSSGRVVRVLAAAYPDTQWHGCDPNRPAISWAQENLPDIEFFANDDSPPLPLPDGCLDLVYAISIWSHFEPGLGLLWFEEMHRLIRPGGHLICTTHGLTSVAHYALSDLRSPEQSDEIADALYRRGWWYAPEFGEAGDWGVVNPAWGTAFLSPEWMLAQLCPRWRVLEFAPGRNQENQDVYLLERV
jgi:SAM-dependent methyltransferase